MSDTISCSDEVAVGIRDVTLSKFGGLLGRNTGTATASVIDDYCACKLRESVVRQANKPVCVLAHYTTEADRTLIADYYPHFSVECGNSANGSHGRAANFRSLELETLMRQVRGFGTVVDVGGSPVQHLRRKELAHCCQPIIDGHDASRVCEQTAVLNSMTSPEVIAGLRGSGSGNGSDEHLYLAYSKEHRYNGVLCHKRSQECDVRADACIFLHSIYDIPFDTMADIMDAHSCDIGYGVFLFPVESLISDTGAGSSHNFEYSVSGGKITYSFVDDPSKNYSHDFDNLKQYMFRSCIAGNEGRGGFMYELYDMKGDAFYFKVIRAKSVDGTSAIRVNESHRIWLPMMREKTIVRFPELIDPMGGQHRANVRMREVIAPTNLIETIVGWMASTAVKDIVNAIAYARSANRRIILNGTTVSVPESVDISDLIDLVSGLSVIDEMRKHDCGRNMEFARSAANGSIRGRFGDSPIGRVADASYVLNGIIKVIPDGVFQFYNWITNRRERDMYYAPTYMRASTFIEASTKKWIEADHMACDRDAETGGMDPDVLVEEITEIRGTMDLTKNQPSTQKSSDDSTEPTAFAEDVEVKAESRNTERDNKAIQEYIDELLKEAGMRESQYAATYKRALANRQGISPAESSGTEQYRLISAAEARKVYGRCCFEGKLVSSMEPSDEKQVLVGESMKYPDPRVKARVAEKMLLRESPTRRVVVQGIPGCGKTYELVRRSSNGCVVISPLRDSVRELKTERMLVAKAGDRGIRTHDSLIVGGGMKRRREIWIDESFTIHEGANCVAERLVKAEISYRMGDEKQIPCVNSTGSVWVNNCVHWETKKEFRDTTRRCPADAAAMMSNWYGADIKTHVPRVRGYRTCKISSVNEVPLIEGATYMAMHNNEVKQIRERLVVCGLVNYNIDTVHRYQGKTVDRVILVRLWPADKALYENKHYINVALTRHRHSCTYYTVIDDDVTATWMSNAAYAAETKPEQYMTDSAYDDWTGNSTARVETIREQYDAKVEAGPSMKSPITTEGLDLRIVADEEFIPPNDEVNVLCDMIDANDGSEEDWESIVIADKPIVRDSNNDAVPVVLEPSVVIQACYDEIFPTHSVNDNLHDVSDVHYKDMSLMIEGRADFGDEPDTPRIDGEVLMPVLRTSMPTNAVDSLSETLLAYSKRNANVPNVGVPKDVDRFCHEMWDAAKGRLFVDHVDTLVEQYGRRRVRANRTNITKWFAKQTDEKKGVIRSKLKNGELSIDQLNMTNLQMLLKDKKKPPMSGKALKEYPATQTLTATPKEANMFYSSLLDVMQLRFKKCLKPNVMMITDKSDEDIERVYNSLVSEGDPNYLEVDISKFDKSQLHDVLAFEMYVYDKLGMDKVASEVLSHLYGETTAVSYRAGFRAWLDAQRKSGASTTLFGNTIVNLFILNFCMNIETFDVFMVKGDDSIITNPGEGTIDEMKMEAMGNFDAKVMRTTEGYMCSSFLVKNTEGYWVLAPDPVKRMESFGHVVPNVKDVLHEKFVSLGDLMRNYRDPVVRDNLSLAVQKRRNMTLQGIAAAIDSLCCLSDDYEKFKGLWYPKSVHVHH